MASSHYDTWREYVDEGMTREEAAQRLSTQLGRPHPANVAELLEHMERIESGRAEESPHDASPSDQEAA